MFKYKFPRPAVTADVVMFTMRADDLAVLLIRRGADPFEGSWALPGGFVDENEPLVRAAKAGGPLQESEEEGRRRAARDADERTEAEPLAERHGLFPPRHRLFNPPGAKI